MPNYKVIDADKFDSDLTMLADGIRAKIGTNEPLHFPDEMAEAIRTRGAKIVPKTIEANGEYYAEEDGADGYSPLTVSVREQLEGFFDNSLTKINLPTITSIKDKAFNSDTRITKVTAPNVTMVGTSAFAQSKVATFNAPKLEDIGESAFSSNTTFEMSAFPTSLRSIGRRAFYNCSKFAVPELPQTIESIGDHAFYGCKRYDITEFPESLRSIGSNAFNLILGTITFKGVPEYIATDAFVNKYNTVINVPWSEGWVANAPWGATYATINYDVFEQEVTLQGAWRFKERFDEGDEVLGPAKSRDDGEVRQWYADFEFTSNGKEFLAIEWDDDLAYIDVEGKYHYVTEYVEDEEGNGHWVWTDEAYRDVVTTSGWYFYVENTYDGIGVPYFYFYRWMTNNAEKL